MAAEHVSPALPSSDDIYMPLFSTKPLVIWTTDFHVATIQDIRHLLEPLGVKFIDKSLTPRCKSFNSCAENLTVLSFQNGIQLGEDLISQFYEAYKNDWEIGQVDAFVCYHPTSLCELYMPFNKSIIIVASTRYEHGRLEAERWQKWNMRLRQLSEHPKNIIAANNLYDAHYIEYFTGIPTRVLPSYCDYTNATYSGEDPRFLVSAGRGHRSPHFQFFFENLKATCLERNCSLEMHHIRGIYPKFEYEDLAKHKAIVHVPYQVSVMSIFEQYRMNIPLFFPSLALLTQWHLKHFVLKEKSWEGMRSPNNPPCNSTIPPHPTQMDVPNPNDECSKSSIEHWLKFADFYNWPHIILYESFDDLISKMESTNYEEVSSKMASHNKEAKKDIVQRWKEVLKTVATYSDHHPN